MQASARGALTCSACLQTERILKSRALFVVGAALYTALLVMWWPRGIGQLCREVYQSCTPLPNVCSALNVWHLKHALAPCRVHAAICDGMYCAPVRSQASCDAFGIVGMLSALVG